MKNIKPYLLWIVLLLMLVSTTGCQPALAAAPFASPASRPSPSAVNTLPPTAPTLAPTAAPTETALPSPTPQILTALTWKTEPRVPVILYHRFLPDTYPESTPTKTRLSDFREHLQMLYDSGYSLAPLEQWLAGDLTVPAGRRPVILTLDDAYFADQLFLTKDGTPSPKTGMGVLWQFYQEHPDFGFSASLFFNLGDKLYANQETATWWIVSDGWEDDLARTIAWGMDHNLMPYSHFYTHPRLDRTADEFIISEMEKNDAVLRGYLSRIQRQDLFPRLKNIVALPYSIWPESDGGKKILLSYRNPEGQPVQAVLEAGYFYDEKTFVSPYSPEYDRFHIPRITTNTHRSIEYLVNNTDKFPAASTCSLASTDPQKTGDPAYLASLITAAVSSETCQPGYYQINGYFFDAREGCSVISAEVNLMQINNTPQPTVAPTAQTEITPQK